MVNLRAVRIMPVTYLHCHCLLYMNLDTLVHKYVHNVHTVTVKCVLCHSIGGQLCR